MTASANGPGRSNIDLMMNLALLYWASDITGDANAGKYRDAARAYIAGWRWCGAMAPPPMWPTSIPIPGC